MNMNWVNETSNWIKGIASNNDLLIVCMGTELRCDDIVGLQVCKILKETCGDVVNVVECPGGLELCTHKIIEYEPKYILIVDGVLANLKPGEAHFTCNVESLENFTPVTTHHIPLNINVKYIKTMVPSIKSVCLLGIQVECLDLGAEPSTKVMESAKVIALTLCNILRRYYS